MIIVLDYGIGNVASIINMLKKSGIGSVVTSDTSIIEKCSKIILPGIGHFDHCMQQFNNSGLRYIIEKKVFEERIPILGVCVGCQMLMENSEEGNEPGLGWIKGNVVKFDKEKLPPNFKIPHMDWTDVKPEPACALYDKIEDPRFYFVHSYHLHCFNSKNITATASYGYDFPASVSNENIMGVQFHPEKSHKFGMQLYSNFIKNF